MLEKNKGAAKLVDLETIVREAEDPRETIRITISLNKSVFEEFKRRCGSAPVSRVVNKILQEVIKNEEAA